MIGINQVRNLQNTLDGLNTEGGGSKGVIGRGVQEFSFTQEDAEIGTTQFIRQFEEVTNENNVNYKLAFYEVFENGLKLKASQAQAVQNSYQINMTVTGLDNPILQTDVFEVYFYYTSEIV